MTEEEWLAATHPNPLLALLQEKGSARKLRLFACACCRRVEHLTSFPEFVRALGIAELFADGRAAEADLRSAKRTAEVTFQSHNAPGIAFDDADRAIIEASETFAEFRHPTELAREAGDHARGAMAGDPAQREFAPMPEPRFTTFPFPWAEIEAHLRRVDEWGEAEQAVGAQFNAREALVQAALLRDIFGNPFRPVALDPAWLTSDVVALAEGLYAERAFDRMPILADALQDAGCANEDVLSHCRDASATHVRGCWVVDLLLGKG